LPRVRRRCPVRWGGAACWEQVAVPIHMAEATMGSIGWPFVLRRLDGIGDIMKRKLKKNVSMWPWELALPPYELWILLLEPPVVGLSPTTLGNSGVDVGIIAQEGGTYYSFMFHPGWFGPVAPLSLISDQKTTWEYDMDGYTMGFIGYGPPLG